MTNKFRNKQNVRLLKGLFFETQDADKSSVVYTLKDSEHMGFPSLYELYMDGDDLTEWSFATQYLDGWEHWEILCNCSWFKPFIDRWRREKEIRLKAQCLLRIHDIANEPTHNSSFTANKFLLDNAWKLSGPEGEPKQASRRGRPSKQDIKEQATVIANEKSLISEDAKRILN